MSDIPRYRPVANDKYGITDDADGKLCEYRDYARLKAELARLRASSFVTAVPVEHYERVIKAGDAMAEALNLNDDVFDNQDKKEAQANWRAAKEGKQP